MSERMPDRMRENHQNANQKVCPSRCQIECEVEPQNICCKNQNKLRTLNLTHSVSFTFTQFHSLDLIQPISLIQSHSFNLSRSMSFIQSRPWFIHSFTYSFTHFHTPLLTPSLSVPFWASLSSLRASNGPDLTASAGSWRAPRQSGHNRARKTWGTRSSAWVRTDPTSWVWACLGTHTLSRAWGCQIKCQVNLYYKW